MPRQALAKVFQPTVRNLSFLAGQLRAGELVGVPTETVYGLAANAFDPIACRRIFTAKRRPQTDPLIVHLAGVSDLEMVCQPNKVARRLARAFWPGPLTLILPKTEQVPDMVTAGRESVAVRVPSHPVFRRLLKLAQRPLAAPSANPFGYVSPTTAAHVKAGLGKHIRFILDGGASTVGLESTILDIRDPARPRLLRPGAITRQQIERVLGGTVDVVIRKAPADTHAGQLAPGMLTRHYSPRTPVVLHSLLSGPTRRDEAYLYFRKPSGSTAPNVRWLDQNGNLRAAARRLFAELRTLDAGGYRKIHAELAPGDGLADAINDRLRRAAARR